MPTSSWTVRPDLFPEIENALQSRGFNVQRQFTTNVATGFRVNFCAGQRRLVQTLVWRLDPAGLEGAFWPR